MIRLYVVINNFVIAFAWSYVFFIIFKLWEKPLYQVGNLEQWQQYIYSTQKLHPMMQNFSPLYFQIHKKIFVVNAKQKSPSASSLSHPSFKEMRGIILFCLLALFLTMNSPSHTHMMYGLFFILWNIGVCNFTNNTNQFFVSIAYKLQLWVVQSCRLRKKSHLIPIFTAFKFMLEAIQE